MTAQERAAERITQLEARIADLEAWRVAFMEVMEGIARKAGVEVGKTQCQILYTIGQVQHEVYGHGDSGDELKIGSVGLRGEGGLPPVFASKEQASAYLKAMEYPHGRIVVELQKAPDAVVAINQGSSKNGKSKLVAKVKAASKKN